jgi:serine/threonine protein kinase
MENHALTDSQWAQYKVLYARLQPLSVEERARALDQLRANSQVDPCVLKRVVWRLRRRPDPFQPGARIGECTLEEELDAGGMGVVYRAQQGIAPESRPVAVKLIQPTFLQTDQAQALARFHTEVAALVRLEHPGITRIYTWETYPTPDTPARNPYIVMQLVSDGEWLTTYAWKQNLSWPKRLALFLQVCDAVLYAHQRGIVHRDLKPANILVNEMERPMVLDFGLAKAYDELVPGASRVDGTPTYMSPEQADPTLGPIDEKSDVYALGVILYELLTGHHPYEEPLQCTPAHWREVIMQELPPPLSDYSVTDQELREITTDALAKQPEARLTLDVLKDRIQNYLAELESQDQPYRSQILKRVRSELLLEDSFDLMPNDLKGALDPLPGIELGLATDSAAVDRLSDLIEQRPIQAPRPLPASTAISDIFDGAANGLLILGKPGVGKTALLLKLMRELLDRAQRDARDQIPIYFHLSDWSVWTKLQLSGTTSEAEQLSRFAEWLIYELDRGYGVSPELAKGWITRKRILPLLDGLDEMAAADQRACIEAINLFKKQDYSQLPLVVCSRDTEYEALPVRLQLSKAVQIQLLSWQQVQHYVEQAGVPLEGLRTALYNDDILRELLNTPLTLSIAALAYHGCAATDIPSSGTLEERRTQLFTAYIDRMFRHRARSTPPPYTREQTEHWLMRLAKAMKDHDQRTCYLEWIQPHWLPGQRHQQLVTILTSMMSGLSGGLYGGLYGALYFGLFGALSGGFGDGQAGWPFWALRGAVNGGRMGSLFGALLGTLLGGLSIVARGPLDAALRGGVGTILAYWLYGVMRGEEVSTLPFRLVMGLMSWAVIVVGVGLVGNSQTIKPVEKLRWSWSAAWQECIKRQRDWLQAGLRFLCSRPIIGLILLLCAVFSRQSLQLLMWLLVLLLLSTLYGLFGGFVVHEVEKSKALPNQGIRRSLRYAATSALLCELLSVLVLGLSAGLGMLLAGSHRSVDYSVLDGIQIMVMFIGLIFGLISGLRFGGHAFLHHYALRIVLWRNNFAPLNYVRFLDYAVARIFLRKIPGGGYMFIHDMLLKHFAARHHTSRS